MEVLVVISCWLMPGTNKERPDGSVSGDLLLAHAWNKQGKT